MGHIRLGNLPHTRKWNQVVDLLNDTEQSGLPQVAAAAMDASQIGFKQAAKDEGFVQTVWLLMQITQAARSNNFSNSLRQSGLSISDTPSLIEILGAFTDTVDAHVRKKHAGSDIGEMGKLAATETISSLVGQEAQSLFGVTSEDVQRAFKRFSTTKQFGGFAKEFFARFTKRYLAYFLSRELSNHVGGEKGRFANIAEHSKFSKALETHCYEASRIVEEFSGGWFSKTKFEEGEITPEKTAAYIYVSLKKIGSELAKGTAKDE